MSGKKNGLGKFVVGAVLVGAAAYGIYKLAQDRRRVLGEEEKASGSEPKSAAPEEVEPAQAGAAEDIFAEEVPGGEEESSRYASVDLKQAADRAYTTIQHSTQEAVDRVKEAVGPKGVEVFTAVGEAAGEVGRTVADSAVKIYDILKEEPEEETFSFSEEEEPAEEIFPDEAPAEEVPAEEPAETVPEAAEIPAEEASAAEAAEEIAEAAAEEEAVETVSAAEEIPISAGEAAGEEVVAAGEAVEEAVTAAAEDMVEEFFDDEEPSDA